MLLSIYPNKLELYVHINNCSGMIRAALFIMVESPRADILECEVKWALGNITMNKTSGGNGIPVELF